MIGTAIMNTRSNTAAKSTNKGQSKVKHPQRQHKQQLLSDYIDSPYFFKNLVEYNSNA